MSDLLANFSQLLFSAFAFILTISFLVAIHEYGHFWVARKFGVGIEKFSIGFGKPIVKWYGKRDNTEYSLSWIPLGGYVKMFGENPNESLDRTRGVDLSADMDANNGLPSGGSLTDLPAFKRMLIAFAGPAVNLIFAVMTLWLLFIIGVPAYKPTLGNVSDSAVLVAADIQSGDRVVSVNDKTVDNITDAAIYLVDALGSNSVSFVAENASGTQKAALLDLSDYQAGNEMAVEKFIGFNWAIAEFADNYPAEIDTVSANSPAADALMQVGDIVSRINGEAVNNWKGFVTLVQTNPGKPLSLEVIRNGQVKALTLIPGVHPDDASLGYAGVSHKIDKEAFAALRTIKRYDWLTAFPKSLAANYAQGELMLKTLGRILFGKASIEGLGGPLTIADYSGQSLEGGYVTYFNFLASISLILAVMNLLPLPVLDGGHIVMCAVEMLRGKPLSERVMDILMRLGGSVLLTFMIFVIGVDVWRYLIK